VIIIMGRVHIQHPNGENFQVHDENGRPMSDENGRPMVRECKTVECVNCNTPFSHEGHIVSKSFTSANGPAFLFDKCVNIKIGKIKKQTMITGEHIVREVSCKHCEVKLGWTYEFAFTPREIYKEGKTVLEVRRLQYRTPIANEISATRMAIDLNHTKPYVQDIDSASSSSGSYAEVIIDADEIIDAVQLLPDDLIQGIEQIEADLQDMENYFAG